MTTAHQHDTDTERRIEPLDPGLSAGANALSAQSSLADAGRYVENLGARLCGSRNDADIEQVSGQLFAIAERIRAHDPDTAPDYRDLLNSLTEVYARGIARRGINPCTRTAAVYAGLISAISQSFHDYDYSDALGQLIVYMGRLFRARENDWTAIYRHIRSMPEDLAARRQLDRALFNELQEWFESGAGNLFSIRDGLTDTVADLTDEAAILGARIDELQASTSGDDGGSDPQIVSLTAARNVRRIRLLKMDQQAVLDERATKEALIELIDTDIRDFENRLIEVRRAYTIHRVSS